MKNFFQNRKMLAAFGTVALLAALLGSTVMLRNNLSAPLLIQRLGNDIVSVGSRIVSVPVSWFTDGIDSVKDLQNAADENSHLKKKVAELAQVEARNAALEKENKQLKAAAGIKNTLTGYTTTTASVISRASDSWSEVLTIDKGKSSGLKKDMAVMSGGGVIGRILEVDEATSKVELITTTDSSANRFAVQATTDTGKAVWRHFDLYPGLQLKQAEEGDQGLHQWLRRDFAEGALDRDGGGNHQGQLWPV